MKTKADAIAAAKEGFGIAVRLPVSLAKPLRAWRNMARSNRDTEWIGGENLENQSLQ